MDPASLATASLVSSVAGTGLSAIGSANTAAANRANAEYQAEVARNNQIISEQNAQYAAKASSAAVTRQQLRERDKIGALTAAMGASGIDVNTGSAARVRSSAVKLGQLDTETKAQEGALRIYGYRTTAANYGAQAGLYDQAADQASTAGLLGVGSTLLTGFGNLSTKWGDWQQTKQPDLAYDPNGNPFL